MNLKLDFKIMVVVVCRRTVFVFTFLETKLLSKEWYIVLIWNPLLNKVSVTISVGRSGIYLNSSENDSNRFASRKMASFFIYARCLPSQLIEAIVIRIKRHNFVHIQIIKYPNRKFFLKDRYSGF